MDLPFGHAEEAARAENLKAEAKKRAGARAKAKRKNKPVLSADEKAQKAKELEDLLKKTAAFSDILTGKTRALGRMGTAMDGQSLGEHNLELAKQPKCMVGGEMRDYQLEGLTWMREIAVQGMSGILADEMGLGMSRLPRRYNLLLTFLPGKTVQTISLVASLREQDDFFGPYLIVAPLSTLSNWMDEFEHWTPTIPVVIYHGTPSERTSIWKKKVLPHYKANRADDKFPIVLTSPQIVLRDRLNLAKVAWEFILIVSFLGKLMYANANLTAGRRPLYEKCRCQAVPRAADLPIGDTIPHHGNPTAERDEGAMVTTSLPPAFCLPGLGGI